MLVSSVPPRRVLTAVAIRVLAGAQVPLDLALVDQVVVLPFPDDPDTPGKDAARSHTHTQAKQKQRERRRLNCCSTAVTPAADGNRKQWSWSRWASGGLQSVSVAPVLHGEDVLPRLGALRRVERCSVRSPPVVEQLAPQFIIRGQRPPFPAN
jgi:hypothetical protein